MNAMRIRMGLVAGALLAACGTAQAQMQPQVTVSVPPFYQAVAKMTPTTRLGQILAVERITTPVAGAEAWRIAYVSSDVQERPTISTGLVMAPRGAMPKEGRPIVSWAHGTTGTAQNCGPSQIPNPAQPLNQYFLVGGNSWSDYGLPAVEAFIRRGYVVVGTDYQGLGGGGAHQYGVAATQARDVINAIRAAGAMKLSGASRKALVYGWSQGGGATIAAASLGDYIARKGTAFDGIDIVGFVAMAPDDIGALMPKTALDEPTAVKMLAELGSSFSGNIFNFAHFAMNLWATPKAFPDLKLTDALTPDGAATVDAIMTGKCMHVISDTMQYALGDSYKTMLRPAVANPLGWAKAYAAGSVTPVKPVAPVIVYWGTADTVVPPVMGKMYRAQMCALGGNVARVQLPGAQTHFSTPGTAEPMYVPWVADRLSGKPAADGCAGGAD